MRSEVCCGRCRAVALVCGLLGQHGAVHFAALCTAVLNPDISSVRGMLREGMLSRYGRVHWLAAMGVPESKLSSSRRRKREEEKTSEMCACVKLSVVIL